jgi:hypothetical protein
LPRDTPRTDSRSCSGIACRASQIRSRRRSRCPRLTPMPSHRIHIAPSGTLPRAHSGSSIRVFSFIAELARVRRSSPEHGEDHSGGVPLRSSPCHWSASCGSGPPSLEQLSRLMFGMSMASPRCERRAERQICAAYDLGLFPQIEVDASALSRGTASHPSLQSSSISSTSD